MNGGFWFRLGELLAYGYVYYACALMVGCVGIHLLLLAAYRIWSSRADEPRGIRRLQLPVELLYGLLNPVVYLLVFQPAMFRRLTSEWMPVVSWFTLGAYWGLRLFGSALPFERETWRRPARLILLVSMALVTALGLRDLGAQFLEPYNPTNISFQVVLTLISVSPLYLIPLLIAFRQLQLTRSPETWRASATFFTRPGASRKVLAVSLSAVWLMAHAAAWRPSEDETRRLLFDHQKEIFAAASRARVDPRLVASILFVTHQEHATPFRFALEDVVASAWLTDATSHILLSTSLDPSLGLTQIKPVTVLTALWIRRESAGRPGLASKEYRDVPVLGEAHERIRAPRLGTLPLPVLGEEAGKEQVVAALREPGSNIALCAFLLNMYATQWESADRRWSIRNRPEVLATLFQIGFEHSHPKPDPQPNDFGRRVREVFESEWMRRQFGED